MFRALGAALVFVLAALAAGCAPTRLSVRVERPPAAPVRVATAPEVEIYFYEKEPPFTTTVVATLRVTGGFPKDTPMEDQEDAVRDRLEDEARKLGADTLRVLSAAARPSVDVRAVALVYAGKGKRPPYDGPPRKKGKKGAKKPPPKKGSGAPTGPVEDEEAKDILSGSPE